MKNYFLSNKFLSDINEIEYKFTFKTNINGEITKIDFKIFSGKSAFDYTIHFNKNSIKKMLNSKLKNYRLPFEEYFIIFIKMLKELEGKFDLSVYRKNSEIGLYNFEIKTIRKELSMREFISEISQFKYQKDPVIEERNGNLISVFAVLEDKIDYETGYIYFKKFYCGNEGILKNGYCIIEDINFMK